VVAIVGMMVANVGLAQISWTGGGDGTNWFDNANWSTSVPGAGDTVSIGSGDIILTNETAILSSFTMTGGTLTFSNWTTRLRADTVDLQGGELTLPPAFSETDMSNRVWIACQDFTLGTNASVNVDGKGYIAANGPGGSSTLYRRGGGGYGGRGGWGDLGPGGSVYGSVHEPMQPGSGGCSTTGGAGGGAVLIQATGSIALYGTISSIGADGSGTHYSGGSGGAIFIDCDQLSGSANALLIVSGGDGTSNSGGGGGGRIAVDYSTLQGSPEIRVSTAPGVGWTDSRIATVGWFQGTGWGTLSLPDDGLLSETLSGQRFQYVKLYFKNMSDWSLANLTIENSQVVFATPGAAVNVAGDLLVDTGGHFGIGEFDGASNAVLTVGNNLVVTNGGGFSVFSGPATAALEDFGAHVVVTNELVVADGSWVYPHSHSTDGGSPKFSATTVTVETGGGFNAHGLGYAGKMGPEPGDDNGARGSGGGHGGRGGSSDAYFYGGGAVNGLLEYPVRPGSGGGSRYFGGGLIALWATNCMISGTLNADGVSGVNLGGGAGGGIVIDCASLSGQSPLFHAEGGDGSSGLGGGGGGGRIALHYDSLAGLVSPKFSTAPGIGQSNGRETDSWWQEAGEGTLWCSTAELLSETIDGDRFTQVRFYADGFDAWTVANLTVSNSAIVFGTDGFELNVTGDMTVGPNGTLGLGAISGNLQPVLNCGGNLTVGAGGALHVFGGRTNGVDLAVGAFVDVDGELVVENGGWIFPYSHAELGSSPRFRADSLDVASDSGFNAIGRGYPTQSGPGAGTFAASWRGGGGGYGGWGGDGSSSARGGTSNGWANAPVFPGSGGGQLNGYNPPTGGSGGGTIWIEVLNAVRLSGQLRADGTEGRSNSGGGSGGGILVCAGRFDVSPEALLCADGGEGQISHGGGGGGGRIALWREVSAANQALLFTGGSGDGLSVTTEPFSGVEGTPRVDFGFGYTGGTQLAEVGTIRFVDGRLKGTLFILR